MNIRKIKVTGIKNTDAKISLVTEQGNYDIWKTEYDKVNKQPGTIPSKPYKQFEQMRVAIGDELDVDVFEKEKSFMGREGKIINYTARSINSFLTGGTPDMNPNGTYKPGQHPPLDEGVPF